MNNPVSRTIYQKMNKKLEKFNKTFHFIFVKLSLLSLTVPAFILSYLVYFTTGIGKDAFKLVFLAE